MIRMENVSMRFGGLYALNDVSFEINEGELFSIIGPNGSGKSTLFNVITGVYSPSNGNIFLQNQKITGMPPSKLNHIGMARTFQSPRIFNDITVLENVMIPLLAKSNVPLFSEIINKKRQEREYENLKPVALNALEVTGLLDKENQNASKLSYGDQKRLEIARCFAISPKIILLDEPVAGLNKEERESINNLAKSLNETGITILLIEHDMKMVMGISDRIMVLNYGKKVALGNPKEISNNPEVIKAYLGVEESDDGTA